MSELQIGDGATILYWSDRRPATIIDISPSGKTVTIQTDKVDIINPNSPNPTFRFEPDPNGATLKVRKAKNGRWYANGQQINLGHRDYYFDESF